MDTFGALNALLAGSPLSIVLVPHETADADALGSVLGLGSYCRKLGHTVRIVSVNGYPTFLDGLPGADEVLFYDKQTTLASKVIEAADWVLLADFSSYNRVGRLKGLLSRHPRKFIIDHHPDLDETITEHTLHFPQAAATAEIVYDIIASADNTDLIDTDIATCLYAGLVTDTRGFRYAKDPARIHEIVQDIVRRGQLDVDAIHEQLYDNASEGRLRLLGYALTECLRVLPAQRTAYFVLREGDLTRFGANHGDTEGLVNYALGLAGIRLAVLIKEKQQEVRLSFRSKAGISVQRLAAEHFNGGGHLNAAGGRSPQSVEEVEQALLAVIKNHPALGGA